MDEMKLKLSTKFMRGIVAKLISKAISKAIYKKFGYKIDIKLNDLDANIINGETTISTNVEVKLDSDEFLKIMKGIDQDD